nr:transaldolase [Chloroflexota bacterium]
MSIYLDSAIPDEARQAMSLGFVRGITTNPALLAKVKRPTTEVLRELCHICSGNVFYQLTAPTVSERRAEAEQILRLNDEFQKENDKHFAKWVDNSMDDQDLPPHLGRIGLKIPASTENMALVAEFSDRGVAVAVTALFSPAQAYLACEAGATYLLPYVNRTTRLRGDGLAFVKELVRICKAVDRGTEVLAASIKSPEEAVKTLLAGAHHISVPLAVLLAMGHDPLSDEAVAEFARAMSSQ